MHIDDRAEIIAKAILWLGGLLLFAWSWQVSGSFIAASVITGVGGLFLIPFLGPIVAVAAFLMDLFVELAIRLLNRSSRP